MRRLLFAVLSILALSSAVAYADTFKLIGAGSLTGAMSDLIRRFPPGLDVVEAPEFGPSGLGHELINS